MARPFPFGYDSRALPKLVEVCGMCECLQGCLLKNGAMERQNSVHHSDFQYVQSQLFHENCLRCIEFGRSSSESLCTLCSHMRLGHITQCPLEASWDPWDEASYPPENLTYELNPLEWSPEYIVGLELILGSIGDLRERSAYCDTCRTFANKASSISTQKIVSSDITVALLIAFGRQGIRDFEFDFTIEIFLKGLEVPQTLSRSFTCKIPFLFKD